jgi:hypothetical protein
MSFLLLLLFDQHTRHKRTRTRGDFFATRAAPAYLKKKEKFSSIIAK